MVDVGSTVVLKLTPGTVVLVVLVLVVLVVDVLVLVVLVVLVLVVLVLVLLVVLLVVVVAVTTLELSLAEIGRQTESGGEKPHAAPSTVRVLVLLAPYGGE